MSSNQPTGATVEADDADDESTACCRAPSDPSEETIAADLQVLTAMASETRYEALRLLAEADGDVCVCDVEPALGVSQGAVSQALSRLFAAGLVTRRKEGRWRYYDATPQAVRLLAVLDDVREGDDD
jgi:ArsR family transcriptional regulator